MNRLNKKKTVRALLSMAGKIYISTQVMSTRSTCPKMVRVGVRIERFMTRVGSGAA